MDIFEFSFTMNGDNYAGELTDLLQAHFGNALPGEPASYGIYLTTATAGVEESVAFWENTLQKTPAFVNPADFPYTLSNAPASCIAKALGVRGPVHTLVGEKDAVAACMLNATTDMEEEIIKNAFVAGFDRVGSHVVLNGMLITASETNLLMELGTVVGTWHNSNPSELIRSVLSSFEIR